MVEARRLNRTDVLSQEGHVDVLMVSSNVSSPLHLFSHWPPNPFESNSKSYEAMRNAYPPYKSYKSCVGLLWALSNASFFRQTILFSIFKPFHLFATQSFQLFSNSQLMRSFDFASIDHTALPTAPGSLCGPQQSHQASTPLPQVFIQSNLILYKSNPILSDLNPIQSNPS